MLWHRGYDARKAQDPIQHGDPRQDWGALPCLALLHPPKRRWAPAAPLPPSPAAGQGTPRPPMPVQVHREALGTDMCPITSPATPQKGDRRLLINQALGY